MHSRRAFTLIELSIVLVIIGLIVGGVLVGRDLIKAAEMRSQLSQIEKFNSAVNTFKGKFNGYLPGDIPNPDATNFGFLTRGQYRGEGDGDGDILGVWTDGPSNSGPAYQYIGETAMFWVDLSTAKLIDQTFISANPINHNLFPTVAASMPLIFPKAKINSSANHIAVWGDSVGSNYFTIQAGYMAQDNPPTPGITVAQAYAMDQKIDDGLPQAGKVSARGLWGNTQTWWLHDSTNNVVYDALPSSASTCYDNGNVFAQRKYSISTNNGAGVNCVLSFKFQ